VEGTGFSPYIEASIFKRALAPEGIVRPTRKPNRVNQCVYFVTTQTRGRIPLFRHERWALLMENVLNHYDSHRYSMHAFVIMPDHLHLLITPFEALEKAVQLFKGGFSYRAKRELLWTEEIWQPGFTEHFVRDEDDWLNHIEYIRQNPVRARLTDNPALYRYMNTSHKEFPQGLKPNAYPDS
jgi:putative transposase